MDENELNKFRDMLDFVFLAALGILLIFVAIFGCIYWKDTKPPPRYTNTLQRDISR